MNEKEFSTVAAYVHDARKPLNRISMQAELVKMAIQGEIPADKALNALDKIIASTKDCSEQLTNMVDTLGGSITE